MSTPPICPNDGFVIRHAVNLTKLVVVPPITIHPKGNLQPSDIKITTHWVQIASDPNAVPIFPEKRQ